MASLQARHTADCALTRAMPLTKNGKKQRTRWTSFELNRSPLTWTDKDGVKHTASCDCKPTYYSVAWLDKKGDPEAARAEPEGGRPAESPHVQVAEDKKDVALLGAGKNITFTEWSEVWLKRLTVQPGTRSSRTSRR